MSNSIQTNIHRAVKVTIQDYEIVAPGSDLDPGFEDGLRAVKVHVYDETGHPFASFTVYGVERAAAPVIEVLS